MSWLLGSQYRQQQPPPPDFGQVPPAAGGAGAGAGGNSGSDDPPKTKMDAYRFDSSALERAAKAAKDLEKSGTNLLLYIIFNLLSYVKLRKI